MLGQTPPPSGPGVVFALYKRPFKRLPNFAKLGAPTERGYVPSLDFSCKPSVAARQRCVSAKVKASFAVRLAGVVKATRAGNAVVRLRATGSARLLVNGSQRAAIRPAGPLAMKPLVKSATLRILKSKDVRINVEWVVGASKSQTSVLSVLWKPPGAKRFIALPLELAPL